MITSDRGKNSSNKVYMSRLISMIGSRTTACRLFHYSVVIPPAHLSRRHLICIETLTQDNQARTNWHNGPCIQRRYTACTCLCLRVTENFGSLSLVWSHLRTSVSGHARWLQLINRIVERLCTSKFENDHWWGNAVVYFEIGVTSVNSAVSSSLQRSGLDRIFGIDWL